MDQAREIIAEASRQGKTVSFGQVAREVGLTRSALQKDAECQRLMPHGGLRAMLPSMVAAIELWEKGGISKAEAARQAGVSSAGLVLAIQRKQREKKDGENG